MCFLFVASSALSYGFRSVYVLSVGRQLCAPLVTRAVCFPMVAGNLLPLGRQLCTPPGRQRCASGAQPSLWPPAVRIPMVASGALVVRFLLTAAVCIPMVARSAPPLLAS